MRRLALIGLVAVLGVLAHPPANAAPAASYSFSGLVLAVPTSQGSTVSWDGAVVGFGDGVGNLRASAKPLLGSGNPVGGTFTLTDAAGSSVSGTLHYYGSFPTYLLPVAGSPSQMQIALTVQSGTGRYAGAQGSGTWSAMNLPVLGTGTGTFDLALTIEG